MRLSFLVCGLLSVLAQLSSADVDQTAKQWQARAESALQGGDAKGAVKLYKQGLKEHPKDVELLNSLGMVFGQKKNYAAAIKYFTMASQIPHDAMAKTLYNMGFTFQNDNKIQKALKYYNKAIEQDSDFMQAHLKAAFLYNTMKDYARVVPHLREAIRIRPDNDQTYVYLGDTLNNLKQFKDATQAYQSAIELEPRNPMPYLSLADTLNNANDVVGAAANYQKALDLSPSMPEALIGLQQSRRDLADWTDWDELWQKIIKQVRSQLAQGRPSPFPPYSTFFYPIELRDQQNIAKSWAKETISRARIAGEWKKPFYKADKAANPAARRPAALRIGYLSRRFEDYAGTKLMLRVFGLHDRSRFHVTAYAHGPDDGSEERRVVRETSDEFRDVHLLNDAKLAQQIADDEIDILVSYDGLHSFNSLGVLALRPAPIQVSYLGFAGTTGAGGVVDYLVSDPIVTPPNSWQFYSEKLALLPGTYQPQDHLQAISDKEFTRQELGLPAKGFVFVCFNRPHKIDPEVFALWMQILHKVPGSVLWLYESIQASPTKQALKQEAAEAGVEPERLIFANKVPKTLHLARLRAADLMLDTLHYNAHTTTSDALWAGVPVLTCPGKTFSSRVAASIVSAAGSQFANKLVADSPAQYVEMAVEFGLGGPSAGSPLTEIRRQLQEAHEEKGPSASFFDSPLYVRGLEAMYERMWQELQTGEIKDKQAALQVSFADFVEAPDAKKDEL